MSFQNFFPSPMLVSGVLRKISSYDLLVVAQRDSDDTNPSGRYGIFPSLELPDLGTL